MTKIVLNGCYGGFGISTAAVCRYAEIKGISPSDVDDYDINRTDPVLVQVVEELGEAANNDSSKLYIVEIYPGTLYRINDYDGIEDIETENSIVWSVA